MRYKGAVALLNNDNYLDFVYVNVPEQKVGVKLQNVTPPTAISNPNSENALQIYPNPAHDVLYINTRNQEKNNSIKILNALGQTVFSNTINSQLMSVDVSKLGANGIYFVQLIDHNGEIQSVSKIVRE